MKPDTYSSITFPSTSHVFYVLKENIKNVEQIINEMSY